MSKTIEVNLIIDQGNTMVKLAVFEEGKLIVLQEEAKLEIANIEELKSKYGITSCVLSSVRNDADEELSQLKDLFKKFIFLKSTTKLPITLRYKTPTTLGCDRIAAVVGAQIENEMGTSMVIDAGTAVTYDVIEEGLTFVGGNISPGLRLRFRALHDYTGKLPLIDSQGEVLDYGATTETAIRSGVVFGFISEIKSYIEKIKIQAPNARVFLTGGDAKFIANHIDEKDVVLDKMLVLKGLNRILEYNDKSN